jgi:hypothetical protein
MNPEKKLTWVKAYNNIYILNAGKFVAKLDLLDTNVPIEYGGDKDYHGGSPYLHKKITIKFKRYVLSVRKNDNIEFVPICYFAIDTKNLDQISNNLEKQEQTKEYSLRERTSIDNKSWTLEGDPPSQEILDRSIEILRAMAFI